MPWLLLDLALVLLGLVALVVVGLRLWRGVKALTREVATAGQVVGAAGEDLSRLQQRGAHAGPAPLPTSVSARRRRLP